jgi:hypothetical protein
VAGSTPVRVAAAGSGENPRLGSPPSDSNTALRVPGTVSARLRTAAPSASSRLRSEANSRMPTGVRTPVAIMSIRPRAGAVHALVQPGSRVARSRPATSSAVVGVVSSGQIRPSTRRTGAGAPEYQRSRRYFGHWSRGSSRIVVSAIEYGAGSVAVSARPTLPNTLATSENWRIARSWRRSIATA